MRSLFMAVAVLGLAVALFSRSVFAEPPPAMEERELSKIIAALKAKPALKTELASARFYAEVLGQKSLQAPIGSTLETMGPWGDNGALLASENEIATRQCALNRAELAAASALLEEFGEALPPTLRALTLGLQGKKSEAVGLYVAFVDQQLPAGACPSEHPMYSHRRLGRIGFALQCLKVFAPTRDVSAQGRKLKRAQDCAANNHAVG